MNQRQWLKTRKHLLESVKNQVFSRLGPPVKSLENYSRKLDREFTRRWQSSSLLEMVQAARSSDLLFLADFHAYHQSQRAHLRLLRQMDLSSSVVFLECLKTQDSHWIDLFWSGEMNEAEFLSAIQWSVNWGFPWEHYRDLILFLKEH
jgi:hypothetical protein